MESVWTMTPDYIPSKRVPSTSRASTVPRVVCSCCVSDYDVLCYVMLCYVVLIMLCYVML